MTNFPVFQDRHKIVSRGDSGVVKDRHTTAGTPTTAGTWSWAVMPATAGMLATAEMPLTAGMPATGLTQHHQWHSNSSDSDASNKRNRKSASNIREDTLHQLQQDMPQQQGRQQQRNIKTTTGNIRNATNIMDASNSKKTTAGTSVKAV
jgi:hypothetical protein